MSAPDPPTPSVDRRIVSVLFADIVGFTPLGERLDPEDVATVQDAYFSTVRETIQRYGGVVEKFIGDAAMAVFGAPRARDDDAERAVRAGLALIAGIEGIGARLGLQPNELQLRVGVNTGEVVHATEGPDAGRVTGDTVNTAARLQTAGTPGTVLIGELTALTVAETIETQAIGPVELKGKAEAIRAWEAIGARSHPSREEALGALHAPMLGRSAELQRLTDALAAAAGSRSATRLVIVAPPGVGKSRLLAEFAASVGSAAVLRARVRPQATAPYETVAQLFGGDADLPRALRDAGVPEARAAVIRAEVTRLVDPGAAGRGSRSDLAAERDARFDAWITALDAMAGGPSAWLIEDVHWAGGDLLAFLDAAGRALTTHGRLVVATARPSLLETAAAWCDGGERLDLAPLPAADARELVHALLGAALPEELVAAVAERSDGTPLFIEELLRTWASVGTLVRDGDAWRLAAHPDEVALPPTVQAIYAAQLDDLPPDARLVARRGAVAGRRLPIAALAALELDERLEGLEALRRRAFLAGPLPDPVTGDAFAYRHALLRDAGYASLARAERARLHVAMARWLTEVAGERSDLVAEAIAEHHALALESLPALAGGALPDRATLAAAAAAWYERAAEAALRLSAVDAARRLFGRAVELTAEDASLDRARRRLRLGEVLASSAELDVGIGEIEAARAELEALPGATEEYERATYALGRAYMQQIRFPEASAVTAEALARLTDASPPILARLHALHAWSLAANGQPDGVAEEADAALAAARAGGDPERELDVLEHWCAARDELDLVGEDEWRLLGEKAEALGRWQQVAVAGRVTAMHRSMSDPAGSIADFERALEVATAHGLTEQAGWSEYALAEVRWVLGDVEGAVAAGERALAVAERYAYERLAFRTFVVLLHIAAERGDVAMADRWDRWWAGAGVHFPANTSPYGQVLRGGYLVALSRIRGEPPRGPDASLLDALQPMVNPHYVVAVEAIVQAWLATGRRDLAEAAGARVAEAAQVEFATPLMRASAALIEAWVTGSHEAAARAAEIAAGIPAPSWQARARAAAP